MSLKFYPSSARMNSSSTMTRRPKFLSLFSGAGGLDLGLETAGFECLASIENDQLARETLALNQPGWIQYQKSDVIEAAADISPTSLGLGDSEQLDLIAGAPPCQPFSSAGQWAATGRRGLSDPRANTLSAFVEIVRRLQPKVVLLENVPGFRSAGAEERFKSELSDPSFEGGPYAVEGRFVECSNYGIPQRRKRLIIVASRVGPFHWGLGKKVSRTAWDALNDISPKDPKGASGKWADLLPTIPEGDNYLWHSEVGGGVELFGNRTRFWSFLLKLSKTEPAWTLAASPGPATGPFHWDNRPLAPIEAQRLQTFPRSWKFVGSHRDQIKLIGNATPPLLGERIGRAVLRHLGLCSPSGNYTLSIPAAKAPPRASQIVSLPEKYRKMIGRKAAHPGTGQGPAPRNQLSPVT